MLYVLGLSYFHRLIYNNAVVDNLLRIPKYRYNGHNLYIQTSVIIQCHVLVGAHSVELADDS